MENETGLTYEVPGADIIARMEERAELAEVVAEDLGQHKDDPCSAGIVGLARRDARALRLSAKYLDSGKTYTLSPSTLREVFLTEPHYVNDMRGLGRVDSSPSAQHSW